MAQRHGRICAGADERRGLVGNLDAAHHAVERIGNSVPPLLMRSIARHVRTLIA